MKLRFLFPCLLAALLVEAAAPAETCTIEITGPANQWKFVEVHDVAAGKVVLAEPIKVGQTRSVTVSGGQIRVDWKFAGYRKYRTGAVTPCKGGNRIRV